MEKACSLGKLLRCRGTMRTTRIGESWVCSKSQKVTKWTLTQKGRINYGLRIVSLNKRAMKSLESKSNWKQKRKLQGICGIERRVQSIWG
jgi:hypothetical protein